MKVHYGLLGLASAQYAFQTRSEIGCKLFDNCVEGEICVVDIGFEQGRCLRLPTSNFQRRDEEQLPGPPQSLADSIYEARQARRKQLLKEKMAKKLWEDQYEGEES